MREPGMREFRGEKLRWHRLANGLSQDELAAKSGIAKGNISKYETGRMTPHPITLRKLAEALGVLPGDLLER